MKGIVGRLRCLIILNNLKDIIQNPTVQAWLEQLESIPNQLIGLIS